MRAEKEKYLQQKIIIEKERDEAYRLVGIKFVLTLDCFNNKVYS